MEKIEKTEKRRSFIIDLLYMLLLATIVYVVLKYAMPFLMPFVLAFILAFALKPIINFLDKKLPLSRKSIAAVVLTVFYIVFGIVLFFLGAKIITTLGAFFSGLPAFYQKQITPAIVNVETIIEDFIVQLDPSFLSLFNKITDGLIDSLNKFVTDMSGTAIGGITNMAAAVPGFVTNTFITIISSFFFTVDYYRITEFFKKQLSEKTERRLFVIKDYVVNVLFSFLIAYAKIISLTFAELTAGLLILRVPNAPFIALGIAVLDILPVLGSGTVLVPWSLYNILLGDVWLGVGLLILYIIITVIRQLAEPRIVGNQIGLYPLLTLISMFVGAKLFGIWGLFGFPIAITVIVHLNKAGELKLFKNYSPASPQSSKDKKAARKLFKQAQSSDTSEEEPATKKMPDTLSQKDEEGTQNKADD